MCMEDVRLGRKSTGKSYNVPIGASGDLLVPYAEDRIALILGDGGGISVRYSWGEQPDAGAGIVIGGGNGPIVLNIQQHGNLVRGPVYCYPVSGAGTVTYADARLAEK